MPRKPRKTETRKGVIYARFSSHAQREESIIVNANLRFTV